jgi:hypothetical protein
MLHHAHHGSSKLIPPNSKQAKCPLVTINALIILKLGLDLSNAFDASMWAVASVAFWSCCWQAPSLSLCCLLAYFSLVLVSLSSPVRTFSTPQSISLVMFFPSTFHTSPMVQNMPPSIFCGQRPLLRLVFKGLVHRTGKKTTT